MRRVFVSLFLISILLLAFSASVMAAENVWVNTSKDVISPGETVIVEVYISNVSNLYGASLDFKFDPSVVQVVTQDSGQTWAVPGNIFSGYTDSEVAEGIVSKLDNTQGTLSYATTLLGDAAPADLTGRTGLFVSFQMIGVSYGDIRLAITSDSFADLTLNGYTTRVNLSNPDAVPITYSAADSTFSVADTSPVFREIENECVGPDTPTDIVVLGENLDGNVFDVKVRNWETNSYIIGAEQTVTGQYDSTRSSDILIVSLPALPYGDYELEFYSDGVGVGSLGFWVEDPPIQLTPDIFTAGQNPFVFRFSLSDSAVDPDNIYVEYFREYGPYGASSSEPTTEEKEDKFKASGWNGVYESDWGLVKAEPIGSGTYQVTIPVNLLVGEYEVVIRQGIYWESPEIAHGMFEVEPPSTVYAEFEYPKEFVFPEGYTQSDVGYGKGKAYNAQGYSFVVNLISNVNGVANYQNDITVQTNDLGGAIELTYTLPSDIPAGRYTAVLTASNGTTTASFEAGKVIVGYPHIYWYEGLILPANTSTFEIDINDVENIPNTNDIRVYIKDAQENGNIVAYSTDTWGDDWYIGADMETTDQNGLAPGEYWLVIEANRYESESYPVQFIGTPLIIDHLYPWVQKAGSTNFSVETEGYHFNSSDTITAELYGGQNSSDGFEWGLVARSTDVTVYEEENNLQVLNFNFVAEDQVKGVPDGYYPLKIFVNGNEVDYSYPWLELDFTSAAEFYDIEPHGIPAGTPETIKLFGWNIVGSSVDVVLQGIDPDNSGVKQEWYGLSPVEFDGREYVKLNVPELQPGEYEITINVTDSAGTTWGPYYESLWVEGPDYPVVDLYPSSVTNDELPTDVVFSLPQDIIITDDVYIEIYDGETDEKVDGPITATQNTDGSYSFSLTGTFAARNMLLRYLMEYQARIMIR